MLVFAVYQRKSDGSLEELFSGDMHVSDAPFRSLLTADALVRRCNDVNDSHKVLPQFRLDLQRIALLAEPHVLQFMAAKIAQEEDELAAGRSSTG